MNNIKSGIKHSNKGNGVVNGIYIAAAKRNSGKTTVSIALSRLFKNRGLSVQPFKKGPDFIDSMWLNIASGKKIYNLDFYFMPRNKIKKHFLTHSLGSDISIVEGNHGLHDSLDMHGRSSNAEMAKLLGLPVIFLIDVGELNRGVVPLIMGFQQFDRDVNIKGIILNKVHSKRHEKNLIKAIHYYTDLKIVGNIPNNLEYSIKQRHLGLLSTLSSEERENFVADMSSKISDFIDTDSIIKISKIAKKSCSAVKDSAVLPPNKNKKRITRNTVKIGIAYDNAFNFYYNENIEVLERLGCEIIKFSPLKDAFLPDVDAFYIGGGFPEIFSGELQANINIRREMKRRIEEGIPVYAECGGLMYLCKSISYENNFHEMVGVIDANVKFTKKPKGHGYTKLSPFFYDRKEGLWFNKIKSIKGHEFHHSFIDMSSSISSDLVFNVKKGFGVNGTGDGIAYKNILAGYTHIYSASSSGWFKNWVAFIKKTKTVLQKNEFLT